MQKVWPSMISGKLFSTPYILSAVLEEQLYIQLGDELNAVNFCHRLRLTTPALKKTIAARLQTLSRTKMN